MAPSRAPGGQGRSPVSMTCPVTLGAASIRGVCTVSVLRVVIIFLVATIVAREAEGHRDPLFPH